MISLLNFISLNAFASLNGQYETGMTFHFPNGTSSRQVSGLRFTDNQMLGYTDHTDSDQSHNFHVSSQYQLSKTPIAKDVYEVNLLAVDAFLTTFKDQWTENIGVSCEVNDLKTGVPSKLSKGACLTGDGVALFTTIRVLGSSGIEFAKADGQCGFDEKTRCQEFSEVPVIYLKVK